MTKRSPSREQQTLQLLTEHGELKLAEVAALLGCKPATASVFLQALRRDGRAWNSGLGHTSVWSCAPRLTPVEAAGRVSSVWEYASRV